MLAVYAAESLLLAFALKLRVAAALAGHRGPRPSAPAAAAALGLDDAGFQKAASFLGQCMPAFVQAPGSGQASLKVAGERGREGRCRLPPLLLLCRVCVRLAGSVRVVRWRQRHVSRGRVLG